MNVSWKQTRPTTSIVALVVATTLATGCVVNETESGTKEFDIELAATGMFLIGPLADVGTMVTKTLASKASTAISQQQTRVTVTNQCEVNQGKIILEPNDKDANKVLSVGDTFKATFDQCVVKDAEGMENLSGEVNVTATGVDATTREATALDVQIALTNAGVEFHADMTYQSSQPGSFRIELKPGSNAKVAVGSKVIPVSAFTAAFGVPRLASDPAGYQVQINLTANDPVYGKVEVAMDYLVQINGGGPTQTDVTAGGNTVRITGNGDGSATLRGTSGEQTVTGQALKEAIKKR